MTKPECVNMLVEDLGVSEPCLDSLKRSGVTTVGDIMNFFEGFWGGRGGTVGIAPDLLRCTDEIVTQLKIMDCWPEGLE